MTKKVCIFLVLIMIASFFAACNSENNIESNLPVSKVPVIQTEDTQNEEVTEEIVISDNDLMCFSSEDDMIKYIKSNEKSNDVANTNELEKYYILENIPDGYELYKITVGVCDIGFWYLPSSRLSSATSISEAESAREYYMLISPRTKLTFSEVLQQHGMTSENLVSEVYYYKNLPTPKLIWEYEGNVMILYLPNDREAVKSDDIAKLCDLSEKHP